MASVGEDLNRERRRRRAAFALFASLQALAGLFFISDAVGDMTGGAIDQHTFIEAFIAVGLFLGTVFGISELRRSHDVIRDQEDALATAGGALAEVIEARFAEWHLTPAEREVGFLALKGFDVAEIAGFRGAAQGTVRAQMASIYAKSGTSGRAQFAAHFVEDLLVFGAEGSEEGRARMSELSAIAK